MSLLVGIDLGTQSAKVMVVEATGELLATGQRRLRPLARPAPGRAEHPDDDLWDALGAACREALQELTARGRRSGDIVGVGLCGIRSCRALVRADGSLAAPVLSWMDARAAGRHQPSENVRWVTASSGYLTHRMTGVMRDSAAAYDGVWPVDAENRRWLPEEIAVERAGMPVVNLPELVGPGEVLGTVRPVAADHTGLPPGVPVVATANDKAVEALGSGLDGDDVLVSLGTYVAAMTPGEQRRPDTAATWTNVAARPGRYLYESAGVRHGMAIATWVRDLVGRTEAELDAEASTLPPGADGLLTVPDWLATADAPHRRGAFIGLDARHGGAHLWRSVVEGLALTMDGHVRAMCAELGRPVGPVLLSGGGSRSALTRRIWADVVGRPIRFSDVWSAAGLGSAICAAVGTGVHESFDAAVTAMVALPGSVEPDPAAHRVYADLALVLSHLADALDDPLRRLATTPDLSAPPPVD